MVGKSEARAFELMTSPVISVGVTDSVQSVAGIFLQYGIGCALVLHPDGREAGVITKTDLTRYDRERIGLKSALGEPNMLVTAGTREAFGVRSGYHIEDDEQSIENWLTPVVYSVPSHAPLSEVLREILSNKVHHLFVRGPASGKIIGVISSMDLVGFVAEVLKASKQTLAPC